MNLLQKAFISIFLYIISYSSLAQTIVPRFINKDQTWTKKGNPYIITQDLLIDTGAVLTITPGTEIVSNRKYYITVKGGVEAYGNQDSFINFENIQFVFTEKSKSYNFSNNQGSYFFYCNFNDTLGGGPKFRLEESGIYIKHCNFNSTYFCFVHTNFDKDSIKLKIEKSNFNMAIQFYNSSGVKNVLEITETNFLPTFSLNVPPYFSMTKSTVTNNLTNKPFELNEKNKRFILKCNSFSNRYEFLNLSSPDSLLEFVIVGNTFNEDIQQVFKFSQFSRQIKKMVVKNNNFLCNDGFVSAPYNYNPNFPDTLIFTKNYWGTVDTALVSKGINDYRDSKNLFLIDFSHYRTSPITECIEDDSVEKTGLPASTKRNKTAEFKFYPNPANQFISILTNSKSIGEYSVLTSSGELVKKGILNFGENIIDVSSFKGGIYLIKVTRGDSIYGYQKLVISR